MIYTPPGCGALFLRRATERPYENWSAAPAAAPSGFSLQRAFNPDNANRRNRASEGWDCSVQVQAAQQPQTLRLTVLV